MSPLIPKLEGPAVTPELQEEFAEWYRQRWLGWMTAIKAAGPGMLDGLNRDV